MFLLGQTFDTFSLSSTLKKNTDHSFSCFAYLFQYLYLSLVFYFFMFHTRILLYMYSYVTNPPSPCASVFVLLAVHPNEITTAGAIGSWWSVHIPGTGPLAPVSYHFYFFCAAYKSISKMEGAKFLHNGGTTLPTHTFLSHLGRSS
jgi:hypothetical protein